MNKEKKIDITGFEDLFVKKNPLEELLINEKELVIFSKQQHKLLHEVLTNFKQRLDSHFDRLNKHDKRIFKLEEESQ